jgi:hypothetical protein
MSRLGTTLSRPNCAYPAAGSPYREPARRRRRSRQPSRPASTIPLTGGRDLSSDGTYDNGAGAVLVRDGSFVANRTVIDDNRSFGFGSGISVVDSTLLRLNQCVVRNNKNTNMGCNYNMASGHTGLGGGIFAANVDSVEIANSAIVDNASARPIASSYQRVRSSMPGTTGAGCGPIASEQGSAGITGQASANGSSNSRSGRLVSSA